MKDKHKHGDKKIFEAADRDGEKVASVELKGGRELAPELPDSVEELQEDGRALVGGGGPESERVAEPEPVLLNQGGETLQSAVVRVQQQLRQSAHLARSVPAVTESQTDNKKKGQRVKIS